MAMRENLRTERQDVRRLLSSSETVEFDRRNINFGQQIYISLLLLFRNDSTPSLTATQTLMDRW